MIVLRKFEFGDAKAVSDLIAVTMRISNSKDYPLEQLQALINYFTPAKVVELNQDRYCLVAEENGLVIATAAIKAAELFAFFVHPDQQRKGVGSQLLRAIEETAVATGLTKLEAKASITGAPFYERRGYRMTGANLESTFTRQIAMEKILPSK